MRLGSPGSSLASVGTRFETIANELVRSGREAPCHRAADLNADGRYNLADPMFLIQWIFLSGPAIPEPFPRCGIGADAASSTLECPEGSVPHCGA